MNEDPICPKCGGACAPVEPGYICDDCRKLWIDEDFKEEENHDSMGSRD